MAQPIRAMSLGDVQQLVRMFEAVEAQPKSTNVQPNHQITATAGGKTETHTYAEWHRIGQLACVPRLFGAATTENPAWRQAWLQLDRQMMALSYSAGILLPQVNNPQLVAHFTALVQRYKQNSRLYPGGDGQLTAHDQAQIQTICTDYPLFAQEILRRNPDGSPTRDEWTSGLIKFCFRSGLSVEVFVEAPNEVDQLMRAHLDKRLGAVDPTFLKFITLEGRRVVALRIDGVDCPVQGAHKQQNARLANLLDPHAAEVEVRVNDIYGEFRKKSSGYGPFEVVANRGIVLWNTIQPGVTDPRTDALVTPLDVTQPDWIQNIPPLGTLQHHELAARYPGQRICEAGQYGFVVRANRENANRDVLHCHAFFDLLVPVPGTHGQQYRLYSVGFQPTQLPDNDWDRFMFLQATLPANVHVVDEGHYLSNRQHTGLFISMNQAEYQDLCQRLANSITRGRQGNKYFQPMNKNCGYFVQGIYDKVLGKKLHEPLMQLVADVIPEWDAPKRKELFKQMTKGLSDDALEEIARTLTQRLAQTNDIQRMQQLLTLCLARLSSFNPAGVADYQQLDIHQVYNGRSPEEAQRLLQESLQQLVILAVTSQQFYKLSLFEAELNKPVFSAVHKAISAVRWEALRLILLKILLFVVFASWRGFAYEHNGERRTARTFQGIMSQRAMLHLPAKLFEWRTDQDGRQQQVAAILQSLVPQVAPFNANGHQSQPQDDGVFNVVTA